MRVRARADYERDIEFLDSGAGAGHMGMIAAKDQMSLFQLRVWAEYELACFLSCWNQNCVLAHATLVFP